MRKTKPCLVIKYQVKLHHLQSEEVAGTHLVNLKVARDPELEHPEPRYMVAGGGKVASGAGSEVGQWQGYQAVGTSGRVAGRR